MAKGRPGMMLYFEDYISLRASLEGDDVLAVIDAMVCYSMQGQLPDESALTPAARICWNFVRPKLDRDANAYQKKSESRRAAANKRWEAEASNASTAPHYANDANACKCIDSMQKMQVQNFMPTQPNRTQPNPTEEEDTPTPPASEMMQRISDHQRAEHVIRRYGLPDNDPTLEAVLEDAEAHGWEKLEAALQTAALSNNRQKVSVVFYRSILTAEPRKEQLNARDPYANYTEF